MSLLRPFTCSRFSESVPSHHLWPLPVIPAASWPFQRTIILSGGHLSYQCSRHTSQVCFGWNELNWHWYRVLFLSQIQIPHACWVWLWPLASGPPSKSYYRVLGYTVQGTWWRLAAESTTLVNTLCIRHTHSLLNDHDDQNLKTQSYCF